jgi:hypothetical protein
LISADTIVQEQYRVVLESSGRASYTEDARITIETEALERE